jgi:hypothetical protein
MNGENLVKEKLKKMAQDKKFISGIYNYCDRWCERCPHTSRCLNYQIGEEEFSDPETRDINNEAFWKKMSEIMKTTLEMLNDMMVSAGIDPEERGNDEYLEEQAIEEAAENHVVCRMAKDYIGMVQEWLDEAEDLFVESGFIGDEGKPEIVSNNDSIEVIQWYQHQIYVKLMRAVSGLIEDSDLSDDYDQYVKDFDGSAKVALIGIDRSIGAWGSMNTLFPGYHVNNTKNILILLDRLRTRVEKAFPKARAFIRPGFDNIDLNS